MEGMFIMKRFIKLTPRDGYPYKNVYVNTRAVQCVFGNDYDGAHITFFGGDYAYLDVKESDESVLKLIGNADFYDRFISNESKEDGSP